MSYDKNCLTSRAIMCKDLQVNLSMKTPSYLGFQHFSLTSERISCPQIFIRYGTWRFKQIYLQTFYERSFSSKLFQAIHFRKFV